eukprot:scaffold52252_cov35-Cyclotella_meneghiniana.AAC.4
MQETHTKEEKDNIQYNSCRTKLKSECAAITLTFYVPRKKTKCTAITLTFYVARKKTKCAAIVIALTFFVARSIDHVIKFREKLLASKSTLDISTATI